MSDTIQQISLQTKFAPLFDEAILIEGEAIYQKSTFTVIFCRAFLTKHRLVLCSTGAMGAQIAFGSLGVLSGLLGSAVASSLKLKKITFQVFLHEIESVTKVKNRYGITTRSGAKYEVAFNKSDDDRWVNELGKLGVKCAV